MTCADDIQGYLREGEKIQEIIESDDLAILRRGIRRDVLKELKCICCTTERIIAVGKVKPMLPKFLIHIDYSEIFNATQTSTWSMGISYGYNAVYSLVLLVLTLLCILLISYGFLKKGDTSHLPDLFGFLVLALILFLVLRPSLKTFNKSRKRELRIFEITTKSEICPGLSPLGKYRSDLDQSIWKFGNSIEFVGNEEDIEKLSLAINTGVNAKKQAAPA